MGSPQTFADSPQESAGGAKTPPWVTSGICYLYAVIKGSGKTVSFYGRKQRGLPYMRSYPRRSAGVALARTGKSP